MKWTRHPETLTRPSLYTSDCGTIFQIGNRWQAWRNEGYEVCEFATLREAKARLEAF